ncbi:MAG: PilZ domain-containing protein [Desulfobacterales bacterium]
MAENPADRRRGDRTEVQWPVTVDTDTGRIGGETLNISEHGVSICCDEGLPLDEVVKMWIMPPDHRIVEVTGQITWSDLCGIDEQNKPVGLGICFLEIDPSDREFFQKVIEKNARPDEER